MSARTLLLDAAHVAAGHAHREDPSRPRAGGPAGNARLTAWTGLVLLVLVVVEIVTALDVTGMLTWHVVVGTILVPVALLKTASTGWRIVRYYTGQRDYRQAGPPPMLLRVLGPLLVASTLGLFGTGLALMALGPEAGRSPLVTFLGQGWDVLTLHQGFFIVFAVSAGLHVLARIVPAVELAGRRVARAARTPGRAARGWVLALVLVAGVIGAALILPTETAWQHDHHFHDLYGRHRFDR
ncbi:MAG: hypothetical protein EPN43_12995 [Jatrophihabitans sp.]|nr:MAG: hypothetical protein EPN43_12995 [Jatrophihabitans sp.]